MFVLLSTYRREIEARDEIIGFQDSEIDRLKSGLKTIRGMATEKAAPAARRMAKVATEIFEY